MTSKERVSTILTHNNADRVAIDYAAREEIDAGLMQALGVDTMEEMLQSIGCDLRFIGPNYKKALPAPCYADPTIRVDAANIHYDIWGVGFLPNETSVGFYMDLARNPLQQINTLAELENYPWPSADDWDYTPIAKQLDTYCDYWTWGHSRGIFEIAWFVRGFNEFMLDLAINPDLANALMDKIQAYLMARTRRILETGAGRIDMIEYNDDVAGQNGMLISPPMWRQFVKPRMAAFIDMCRAYNVKIRYHCCGGMREILPDLIEIGVDVLNPVQTLAMGMQAEGLKSDFGARLAFSGGVDTQELLPTAMPEEVRQETLRLIDIFGKNGGYILGPSHVFQADVPVANVLAIYEAGLGR
jgi:uroporphyrinogen decarboxylase